MEMVLCGPKVFLLVSDAGKLHQEPRIAWRFAKAGIKCEFGLVPFLQPRQSKSGEKIKIRRLIRGPSSELCGFLPLPSVKRALHCGKSNLIRGGILGERGETQHQHCG
ncbi:MAG: hypothetical protein AUI12_15380 [Acidobacteria bacterium 13_2_20CM_2_57_6]|nr:MAG: hypothetical protein AUI12_15380 [Acidobacteria bacterium 13_2_20CM_2_57_6]